MISTDKTDCQSDYRLPQKPWILIQSVPKTFWQTSRNNILEKRKKKLSKFYVIFTSLNQFVLDWGIGLVVFGADGNHSDSQFYQYWSWRYL
jgi:hypothetical protein